ncbi:MAG: chemotaxis-specific protein-glutamate methyltransferase CheB [Balneolales bacterium]|nr:chemotaxis-specific protein-glutamate methyltransferase CheB [Balneolales bacterium]
MNSSAAATKIRVLIVDDSITSRKLHQRIIESDPGFEVAGMANDGQTALKMIRELRPDVVSMDIHMPVMDGIEATLLIMQQEPVPILIVSSLYNDSEKELAVRAMAAGAVYIMPKPNGPGHENYGRSSALYLRMLRNMAGVKVVRRKSAAPKAVPRTEKLSPAEVSHTKAFGDEFRKIVVIGASAGGPEALRSVLGGIPESFPFPILVVQHIHEQFTDTYRKWLGTHTALNVLTAEKDQKMSAGTVYIAPGGTHLELKSRTHLTLTAKDAHQGHRPSVSVLFESAERIFGSDTLAVMLSGMGRDGADEMIALKRAGALTLVQNEESCLVFGMPGSVVSKGGATLVLPPELIAGKLNELK